MSDLFNTIYELMIYEEYVVVEDQCLDNWQYSNNSEGSEYSDNVTDDGDLHMCCSQTGQTVEELG